MGSSVNKIWSNAIGQKQRHEFARMCAKAKDTFEDVIWTDESSIQLMHHSQTMSVKIRKREFEACCKAYSQSSCVAGLSKRGATHICKFDQIMDGPLYVKILEDFLLPFVADKFQGTQFDQIMDGPLYVILTDKLMAETLPKCNFFKIVMKTKIM